MKKHATENIGRFTSWFPEIDKKIFEHFRVKSIVIKVEGYDRKPVEFKYDPKAPDINPLADYRS